MRWISYSLLSLVVSFGFLGCRASFQDIQKPGLVSSGDDLGAKDSGSDAVPDDAPILENKKELPPEESDSYGCDGTVIIHEKGRDRNKDGVLQPTEVTDISTECRPKDKTPTGGGKDPDPVGGGKTPPAPPKCPNQSGSKDTCDDSGQNNPTQSGKK